jgi:hypothetical protein
MGASAGLVVSPSPGLLGGLGFDALFFIRGAYHANSHFLFELRRQDESP